MKIYLDNAATTPLDEEVLDAMLPYFNKDFGNASSRHQLGRDARLAVEHSRKSIAELLNADPSEIIFTSGGTEANNTAIFSAIRTNKIKHAITSRLEHHAVLNPLKALERDGEIQLHYIENDTRGNLNLAHLQTLLRRTDLAFVSVMHANNEIGNLNPIHKIASICQDYDAIFHSDTVQTIGHKSLNVKELNADFITASAHKFHGPKGVGFLYKKRSLKINPFVYGGSQESRQRAGTENTAGIVGLTKALEITYRDREKATSYFSSLKKYAINRLKEQFPEIRFNGNSADPNLSIDSILNFTLPENDLDVLTALDLRGIFVSGGSACTSGTSSSYLLNELGITEDKALRLSFSKYNTTMEIDFLINNLERIYRNVNRVEVLG